MSDFVHKVFDKTNVMDLAMTVCALPWSKNVRDERGLSSGEGRTPRRESICYENSNKSNFACSLEQLSTLEMELRKLPPRGFCLTSSNLKRLDHCQKPCQSMPRALPEFCQIIAKNIARAQGHCQGIAKNMSGLKSIAVIDTLP